MRITFLLPGVSLANGGIKSTFELANRLQNKGHEVTVVYPLIPLRNGARWSDLRSAIDRSLTLAANLKRRNEVKWFDLKAKLLRVLDLSEGNIPPADVVVATWWSNAYDVAEYGSDKGSKFHFIRHYEVWGGPKELVDKSYQLPLTKMATSSWLCELIENKFGVQVIGPLPNGVDRNIFFEKRNGHYGSNIKRVGMLYRATSWKGVEDGLKAYTIVHKIFPETKLVLFGAETPSRSDIKHIREIGDVELIRIPTSDGLREAYNSLDIFLFPSHHEGFGNPPMEAMACGTACVTTPVGGIPDYSIDGKTAIWVEPGNPKAIASAIIGLLSDEGKLQSIAAAGHEYINRFTWERTVAKLEKIFQDTAA